MVTIVTDLSQILQANPYSGQKIGMDGIVF